MATLWLTYAHADNQDKDVDFIAQELKAAGVEVRLDRWVIGAGRRLWEQIESGISSSDAWLVYATANSLGSEPCREELAYALNKALSARGAAYPVIALFPASVDTAILPSALKVRLCLTTTDDDWKERTISAAEGRLPNISPPTLDEFVIKIHQFPGIRERFIIELRPRAGVWSPVILAVPAGEGGWSAEYYLRFGGKNTPDPSAASGLIDVREGVEGPWAFIRVGGQQATPTFSAYVHCAKLPSKLLFGSATLQYIAENLEGPIRVARIR